MTKTQLPITNGFYIGRSLPVSAQECKDLYVHIVKEGGFANEVLYGTSGANQLATSGESLHVNRGGWTKNKIPYFVNGENLYRLNRTVSAAGVESFDLEGLGTIPGEGRVSMANNNTQLCILVPGGDGYIYNEDAETPFQQIIDADFKANGNPRHVVFIDRYFLFTTDTNKLIISALNDGLSYNALDFGSAEADPDEIIAPVVLDNELYIGGRETFEPFRNIGGSGFPFARIAGGVESIGVTAPFSLIKASKSFFFIGGGVNDEPSIYKFDGTSMSLLSNDGIDELLQELTEVQLENVFAWTYSQGGARFIGWTLPTTTIVYDIVSSKWHERKSFDIIDEVSAEFRWRANSVIKAYNRILVGDNQDGRVGEIDLDIYSEYDQNILRSVVTMPFSNIGDRLLIPSIELTIESGVGNENDVIRMERSIDGKTWTDGRTRKIGSVGKNKNRLIWRRNGRAARFELFRFTTSAKAKIVFIKLEANIL